MIWNKKLQLTGSEPVDRHGSNSRTPMRTPVFLRASPPRSFPARESFSRQIMMRTDRRSWSCPWLGSVLVWFRQASPQPTTNPTEVDGPSMKDNRLSAETESGCVRVEFPHSMARFSSSHIWVSADSRHPREASPTESLCNTTQRS